MEITLTPVYGGTVVDTIITTIGNNIQTVQITRGGVTGVDIIQMFQNVLRQLSTTVAAALQNRALFDSAVANTAARFDNQITATDVKAAIAVNGWVEPQ
jgi:hypothetical protein